MPFPSRRRGRAEPALPLAGGGAEARAGGPEGEVRIGRLKGGAPQRGVGVFGPVLFAAVQQIEKDRGRHDRGPGGADGKAASHLGQPVGHAGGGGEAEDRATRQDQCIDLLDQPVGGQQVGFAGAGRPAHDADSGGEGPVGDKDGRPRPKPEIMGVSDPQARDIGDEVSAARLHSGRVDRAAAGVKIFIGRPALSRTASAPETCEPSRCSSPRCSKNDWGSVTALEPLAARPGALAAVALGHARPRQDPKRSKATRA